MNQGQVFNADNPFFSLSCLRYSLTKEGLALAERLESAEHGPAGDRGEVGSEGEEQEENNPGVVDLTASDDGEDEPSSRSGPAEADGMVLPGRAQISQARSRNPNAWSLLPGTYEIILCVDFIETTG